MLKNYKKRVVPSNYAVSMPANQSVLLLSGFGFIDAEGSVFWPTGDRQDSSLFDSAGEGALADAPMGST